MADTLAPGLKEACFHLALPLSPLHRVLTNPTRRKGSSGAI
ncbi:hypothetical protein OQ496_07535 [Acetobacter suratthaniensis]|nr:hypothetical protein [Acetobacter suratthaniensis]MCX2566305.1 hypothetical protein [Acetobacter suratthaniensis]